MAQYDIAVIGGDLRLAYMASVLSERGYKVICYGIAACVEDMDSEHPCSYCESLKEAVESADILVAGIPFLKKERIFAMEELEDLRPERLYQYMRKGQCLFAGVIPADYREKCLEKEVTCFDFMQDEALAVFNAIATAEGAILEAIRNQETNLHGSNCLVLGYGRCGKVLAQKLKGLSAEVTVCCRNEEQLAYADAFGMQTISLHNLEEQVQNYEYIFNTIPQVILRRNILKKMRRDVLMIDLASKEGGIDYHAAKTLGLKAMLCPGLPGKYAPKVSAKGLVDYVERKETGNGFKRC